MLLNKARLENSFGIKQLKPMCIPKVHHFCIFIEDLIRKLIRECCETKTERIALEGVLWILLGTTTVLIFADPLVQAMTNLSKMIGIDAFYIAFVLTPIASNASELFNVYFFSIKKTKKNISLVYVHDVCDQHLLVKLFFFFFCTSQILFIVWGSMYEQYSVVGCFFGNDISAATFMGFFCGTRLRFNPISSDFFCAITRKLW